jgi:hypothetical protein
MSDPLVPSFLPAITDQLSFCNTTIKDAHDHFAEQCVSHDPKAIVATLQVWASLGQDIQRKKFPLLRTEDLEPLRRPAHHTSWYC